MTLSIWNLITQEICHDNQSYLQMLSLTIGSMLHCSAFVGGNAQQMISQLNNDFFRLKKALSHHHDWDRIIAHHRAILDAVKENKPDTAAQTMQEHLRMVIVERKRLLQEFPDYFAQP